MGLTIGNLGDDGPGSADLGLAVGDLGDNRPRGADLGLAIADLGDDRAGCGPRSTNLGLAVGDLGDDGPGGADLGLAIADLGDDGTRSSSLRLTIGNLGHAGWLSYLRLSIWDLGSTSALLNGGDVDGDTLRTSALAVQVIEGTREALVPDSWRGTARSREGKRAVAADREASRLTSTSLKGRIKLELVVAGNVALAAGLVPEDTILEGQSQSTSKLASREVALSSGTCDIDSRDVECSRGGRLATCWGRVLGQSRSSSKGKDSEGLHSQKIYRTGVDVTGVGVVSSEGCERKVN